MRPLPIRMFQQITCLFLERECGYVIIVEFLPLWVPRLHSHSVASRRLPNTAQALPRGSSSHELCARQ